MVEINFTALPLSFNVIKLSDTLLKPSSNCCRFTTLRSKGLRARRKIDKYTDVFHLNFPIFAKTTL